MISGPSSAYPLSWTALLPALVGCGGGNSDWVVPTPAADQTGQQIHVTGVVRYSELEGGFYAIRGAEGITYTPANPPAEFRKDGLPVEAEARRRSDMVGIHQVGPIIQLVRIRARKQAAPAGGGGAPAAPEGPHLEPLQRAERYVVQGSTLSTYSRGTNQPLRVTRKPS